MIQGRVQLSEKVRVNGEIWDTKKGRNGDTSIFGAELKWMEKH